MILYFPLKELSPTPLHYPSCYNGAGAWWPIEGFENFTDTVFASEPDNYMHTLAALHSAYLKNKLKLKSVRVRHTLRTSYRCTVSSTGSGKAYC